MEIKAKKYLGIIIGVSIIIASVVLATASSYADTDIASGVYDGVPWKITKDYDLIIGEEGKEYTFDYKESRFSSSYPWDSYRTGENAIKTVSFKGTVYGNGSCAYMFYDCSSLTSLNMSNFDTSQVRSMRSMFHVCSSLTSLDVSSFDISQVTDMCWIFSRCYQLEVLIVGEKWKYNGAIYYKPEFPCKFADKESHESYDDGDDIPDLPNHIYYADIDIAAGVYDGVPWEITKAFDLIIGEEGKEHTFDNKDDRYDFDYPWHIYSSYLKTVCFKGIVHGNGSCAHMFRICDSLVSLDVSKFDTSQVTSMNSMFNSCRSLTSLDLSNFDTSQVTDMGSMFYDCKSLTGLDVSNFDTSKVTDMGCMFTNCNSLSGLDVSKFDTSQVMGMIVMFSGCSSLTSLDVSNFDTSWVMDMSAMFSGCSSLTSLDVSNFDTSWVMDMSFMFSGCSSLTNLDLSNFDISKAMNMSNMFSGCKQLEAFKVGKKWKYNNRIEPKAEFPGKFADKKSHESYDSGDEIPGLPSRTYYAHYLVRTKAVAASCTKPGNSTYWTCSICNKYFSDEDGNEIMKDSWVLPELGHNYQTVSGSTKAVICSRCGAKKQLSIPIKESGKKAITRAAIPANAVYSGNALKPKVKVMCGRKALRRNRDYTISYSNNRNVGTATVIVKGKGNYYGTIKGSFKIVPSTTMLKKAKSSSVKGGETQVVLTLKSKPKCKVTYYRVQLARDRSFTRDLKIVAPKLKGKKLGFYEKLAKKKKYYVRVQAITVINKIKYQGPWSTVKTIKGK